MKIKTFGELYTLGISCDLIVRHRKSDNKPYILITEITTSEQIPVMLDRKVIPPDTQYLDPNKHCLRGMNGKFWVGIL